MEGVVCGLLDGLDALATFAPTGGQLIVVGGGARSRAYRQVLADLGGREVLVPHVREQVSSGGLRAGRRRGDGQRARRRRGRLGSRRRRRRGARPGHDGAGDVRAAYIALRDATAG